MIHVNLRCIDFQNEIEDVIRLFYKDKDIMRTELQPSSPCQEPFLTASLEGSGNNAGIRIIFSADGKYNSILVPFVSHEENETSFEERKRIKREIKRSIYMLLSRHTGKKMPWGILTGIRPVKIVHEMIEKGISREDIEKKLTGYFMVSENKAALIYDIAETERFILNKTGHNMVSLYIGIPFCPSRCLYCSFTSNPIDKYSNMVDSYMEALKKEIAYFGNFIRSKGYKVQSIYIGGGTPTSIDRNSLRRLLVFIEENIDLSKLEEFTLEAGRPDSIDREKLETIRSSAVTRISINPQTMNDVTLGMIGRNHKASDIVEAFGLARDIGFENINMDIIAGLPGENLEMFENTLRQIKLLDPENLTVHAMAVKRASRLKEEGQGFSLIDAGEALQMADMALNYAQEMDMHPYYLYRQKNITGNLENIGYCKRGFESIYNIQIMEERQSIFAFGAGAVTKVIYPRENRIERAFNVKNVEEYIKRIDEMIERKKVLFEGKANNY